MSSAVPAAPPRVSKLLSAQFASGFGGRFHGVLLGLYALHLGGLGGFAGFAAAAMIGSGLSALAAGGLTSRLGGAGAMRAAGLLLAATRIGSYVLLPIGLPLAALLGLRLLGSISGTLIATGAKSQVRGGETASASLAWMNVSSGAGQAIAAVLAGLLSVSSPMLIAVIGAPVAVASTWPMLRMARYSSAAPVPLRDQLAGLRSAGQPVALGAVVFLVLAAVPNLADGLTVELYSASWLGALTAVTFAGSLAAATALPLLARRRLPARLDRSLWPALGALGAIGWGMADRGVVWLLAARFVAAFAAQALAALVEARVLERAGSDRGLPALSASGAVAAFGAAGATAGLPSLLGSIGFAGVATWSAGALVVVGVIATLAPRGWVLRRGDLATAAT